MPSADSRELVVRITPDGEARGVVQRMQAHRAPGLLHAAVSVVLGDGAGRVLIQRRALQKPLFAGLWSNSCCTHPLPDESEEAAVWRRVPQELGVAPEWIAEAGVFTYRALDPVSGLTEYERDVVFAGELDAEPRPDPAEVSEWAWVDLTEETGARRFTPWASEVFSLAIGCELPGRARTKASVS